METDGAELLHILGLVEIPHGLFTVVPLELANLLQPSPRLQSEGLGFLEPHLFLEFGWQEFHVPPFHDKRHFFGRTTIGTVAQSLFLAVVVLVVRTSSSSFAVDIGNSRRLDKVSRLAATQKTTLHGVGCLFAFSFRERHKGTGFDKMHGSVPLAFFAGPFQSIVCNFLIIIVTVFCTLFVVRQIRIDFRFGGESRGCFLGTTRNGRHVQLIMFGLLDNRLLLLRRRRRRWWPFDTGGLGSLECRQTGFDGGLQRQCFSPCIHNCCGRFLLLFNALFGRCRRCGGDGCFGRSVTPSVATPSLPLPTRTIHAGF